MRRHIATEQTFLGDMFFVAENDNVHRITNINASADKFIKICMADRTCEAGQEFNLIFEGDVFDMGNYILD